MARHRRPSEARLNLDSLTDIMANTVGIMIFVMIFAVITARGSFMSKGFPRVQATNKQKLLAFCMDNKVIPCEAGKLVDRALEPLRHLTYDNMPRVVDQVNSTPVRDEYFEVTVKASMVELLFERQLTYVAIALQPRADAPWDTVASLSTPSSSLVRYLRQRDKTRCWLELRVDPRSLEVFSKTREVAYREGFESGWDPTTIQWPLRQQVYPPLPPPPSGPGEKKGTGPQPPASSLFGIRGLR